MNVIVNSSGIYRYENSVWVIKSTDSVSGDVRFSDDGDVIAQLGYGLWEWNSGYVFTSQTNLQSRANLIGTADLTSISRDGTVYSMRTVGAVNDSFLFTIEQQMSKSETPSYLQSLTRHHQKFISLMAPS